MQSAQESLAELRAAIRYCENAISAAESTIESMDFRQQLAKQQAMKKQESTGREQALEEQNNHLHKEVTSLERENTKLREEVDKFRKQKEASSGPCGCQAYRDLEEKVATMPVIPRDVAIAIFREGQRRGYNDKSVAENLKGLCERKGFECRIHGVDDQETNK